MKKTIYCCMSSIPGNQKRLRGQHSWDFFDRKRNIAQRLSLFLFDTRCSLQFSWSADNHTVVWSGHSFNADNWFWCKRSSIQTKPITIRYTFRDGFKIMKNKSFHGSTLRSTKKWPKQEAGLPSNFEISFKQERWTVRLFDGQQFRIYWQP
jgi:hypothetical protein